MRTRIWHSDWKPRWLIRCVSAALLSFMDKQEKHYLNGAAPSLSPGPAFPSAALPPRLRSGAPGAARDCEEIERPFQGQIVRRDVFRHGCVDAPVGDEGDLSLIERLDGLWSLPEALSREEPDLGFLFELEQALAQRERKRAEAPP